MGNDRPTLIPASKAPEPEYKTRGMAMLASLGIKQVEIPFDGGNDDGGWRSISYTTKDLAEEEFKDFTEDYPRTEGPRWDPEKGRYVTKLATTDEEKKIDQLWDDLLQPIYSRWSSFAGDFYVSGVVTWDVPANQVRLMYNEEVSVWTKHEDIV